MKNKILTILPAIFFSLALSAQMKQFDIHLYDTLRNRAVPVAIYAPETIAAREVIIFSHGYNKNTGNPCKDYSYLTGRLANEGYFVISVQHELPDDDLLVMEGNLYETRMPNWERGVQNILFVLQEMKNKYPALNWQYTTLVGHSNGGDISMLLAARYPEQSHKVISLDHRRVYMPRTSTPRLYSLRGCDYEADPDVIPSIKEQELHHIRILYYSDIGHSDMDNKGTPGQKETICRDVLRYLKEQL